MKGRRKRMECGRVHVGEGVVMTLSRYFLDEKHREAWMIGG